MNKRQYKIFLLNWLKELVDREPKLRGRRLKWNKHMQESLIKELGHGKKKTIQ